MDDYADIIVQGIPRDSGFTDMDRWQARSLIESCHQVATREVTPAGLGSDITKLRNGYGPWLDTVRSAIQRADIPALDRATLLGAFEMATVVLFDAREQRYARQRQ